MIGRKSVAKVRARESPKYIKQAGRKRAWEQKRKSMFQWIRGASVSKKNIIQA